MQILSNLSVSNVIQLQLTLNRSFLIATLLTLVF